MVNGLRTKFRSWWTGGPATETAHGTSQTARSREGRRALLQFRVLKSPSEASDRESWSSWLERPSESVNKAEMQDVEELEDLWRHLRIVILKSLMHDAVLSCYVPNFHRGLHEGGGEKD